MENEPEQRQLQAEDSNDSSIVSLDINGLGLRPQSSNQSLTNARKSKVIHPIKFENPKDLLMAVTQVVKNRTGSVLGRQMILKSDHFDTALNDKLDVHLQGAPNFRMADMNIFGVAQPTIPGIQTVLTLLRCHPSAPEVPHPACWISAREDPMVYINRKPFVIRDAKLPLQNISTYQGIKTSRLEQMEIRLKQDIIQESQKWNGLVLVHEERDDETIIPKWMGVDHIQTPREVFESLGELGYQVEYDRIPISPEQAPQDNYWNEFIQVIQKSTTSSHLIFNCGMGVGRTTCAMVIAMLIRSSQLVARQEPDPLYSSPSMNSNEGMVQLLRLLNDAFPKDVGSSPAIEWAMARTPILGDLIDAMAGKYRVVTHLCSLLKNGDQCKSRLDTAIDRCGLMINLRQNILVHRVRYSLTGDIVALNKASGCLERYLYLLAVCSFLQDQLHSKKPTTFNKWLERRQDVSNILSRARSSTPPLSIFLPCEDLSVFSHDIKNQGLTAWGPHSQQPATELDKYVIKSRSGSVLVQNTILKEDYWLKPSPTSPITRSLKGASNFRKIQGFSVYGVAQPTLRGVKNVLSCIFKETQDIVWINLREEPFIYINGIPYVLRDTTITLRNIKSFSGITAKSLETIEWKLKQDVAKELDIYGEKILLHAESVDGSILPVWEDCNPDAILSLKDAMEIVGKELEGDGSVPDSFDPVSRPSATSLKYYRVPQTAECSPDCAFLDYLIQIIGNINLSTTSIVLNCQIGIGRSTLGTIVVCLIINWLSKSKKTISSHPSTSSINVGTIQPLNYQLIHSLLRVIRNGIESKRTVDRIIDSCSSHINLRDIIEERRQAYETERNKTLKEEHKKKGIVALDRYFTLILFQNYLDQNAPGMGSDLISFKQWVTNHPEFETIREELLSDSVELIVPVAELEPGDGIALTTEVIDVVHRRKGAVLSQGTIIKFDLFPGAQKMSLSDRIQGAHNYRKVIIGNVLSLPIDVPMHSTLSPTLNNVSGVGMPTKEGIKHVLEYMGAGPTGNRTAYWTSLREEPVIYIKGRPYVLRLFIDPIKNLVTTGIARKRVEEIEVQMKKDIIQDMKNYNNRVLLHEEDATFLVTPLWETCREDEIETPLDVYNSICEEGYKLDYLRIPITDELSPIPDVFNQMIDRILSIPLNSDPIFNCQMGRGRTTQGLVITCLMKLIVGNQDLKQSPDSYIDELDSDLLPTSPTNEHNLAEVLYKSGQYSLILQLIAVLQFGKCAKYLTDKAIDACDHMQNLRVAIYDYRIRLNALEPSSSKYKFTLETGCNYLVRYFYLITFADYLIENWACWSPNEQNVTIKFSDWLDNRREIQNIIRFPNMD
ncbi:inositol hexakisphosphate-domain-containing protein [Globomyces pollinis-pini]|nr:inositol hexakisphosphate-domain-containing protein [Globomyces pollinis-pini]